MARLPGQGHPERGEAELPTWLRTARSRSGGVEVRMGAGNSGVGLQVPRCFFPSVCSTPCILLKGRLPALGPGSEVGVKGEEGHRGQENLDTPTDSTWAQGFDLTSG